MTVAAGADGRSLDLAWDAADPASVQRLRLLDDAPWTTDAEAGSVAVPVRLGLLVPAGGKPFAHTFDTYAYEGCHMAMAGVVKAGAAALVTWDDPYAALEVRRAPGEGPLEGRQVLSLSLAMRKSARRARVTFLGKGDHVTVARAYRDAARARGWLVGWDEKLAGHPGRARYFGASNVKLWSLLARRMNEESTREESVRVNWTFDDAARVAEHLRRDLGLERVLFILGGWIRRGYDNQHPDVLPSAPECGGDAAFADACRRIRACGYLLSLHDNYQDIYRDSPSWDERYVMRRPDGGLVQGGRWAGGRAYLTCSRMALDLARRPGNLEAVRALTGADSYFIDTTYAAGLQECFAPEHPLTRLDDMRWKQALSDYARGVFGSFGSECGREWAVPHADFFEGLTGVSGRTCHDAGLVAKLGAAPAPLFELVYRDCIQMYGKYGYDIYGAAAYVARHVSIARPLHYHGIPPHLYWEGGPARAGPGRGGPEAVWPQAAEVRPVAGRQFRIAYRWRVEKPVGGDWIVFVHFTDPGGQIRFQNDHAPDPPTSKWPAGDSTTGPFTVAVPAGLEGTFDVRVGFYSKPSLGRVSLIGASDGEQRYVVGKLKVAGDRLEFTPLVPARQATGGDPALYVRSDRGWAEGLHPMDVFLKNTHEVLSPLNEMTSRLAMTGHEFLTPDRAVVRTVFGEGAGRVAVTVNLGQGTHRAASAVGGEAALGPYGFLAEAADGRFVAFCATAFGGLEYGGPALFVVDRRAAGPGGPARVYHGFGDPRIRLGGQVHTVPREATVRF